MTKRELRRLAYRTTRDRSLTPVLHDALLETYPEYEKQIEFAEKMARTGRTPYIVVFNPRAMASGRLPVKYGGRLNDYVSLFSVYGGGTKHPHAPWRAVNELRASNSFMSSAVIVYVTRAGRGSR